MPRIPPVTREHRPAWPASVEREQLGKDAAAVDEVVAVQAQRRQAQGDGSLQGEHVDVHVIDDER